MQFEASREDYVVWPRLFGQPGGPDWMHYRIRLSGTFEADSDYFGLGA